MRAVTAMDADELVVAELRKHFQPLGVHVYEDVRPNEAALQDGKTYIVFFGSDIRVGSPRKHRPITGWMDASVFSSFGVYVAAESAKAKRGVVRAVRDVLLGIESDFMSDIHETGAMNSYSDTDGTVKPIKYTWYGTFQCLVDRS